MVQKIFLNNRLKFSNSSGCFKFHHFYFNENKKLFSTFTSNFEVKTGYPLSAFLKDSDYFLRHYKMTRLADTLATSNHLGSKKTKLLKIEYYRSKKVLNYCKSDPVFGLNVYSYFINVLLRNGDISKASKILYKTIYLLKKKYNRYTLLILFEAMSQASLVCYTRKIYLSGKKQYVPYPYNRLNMYKNAIKNIIKPVNQYSNICFSEKLVKGIEQLIFYNSGPIASFIEDNLRIFTTNRRFVHYRW